MNDPRPPAGGTGVPQSLSGQLNWTHDTADITPSVASLPDLNRGKKWSHAGEAAMTTTPALDIARQLAAEGIPIFVAHPDPSAPTGYRLPSGWQRTIPNPAVVDSWRPGMALCAVMGHGIDLVDIDPRNGGDPAALDGKMPISYGYAATPSGGVHSFVKSLGVRSCDNVVSGIDIKAGNSMCEGHGFAFIAPTERVSKIDGVKRVYEWITSPDLHRLKAEGSQDDSGKALIRLINAKRNGHRPASSGVPTPAEFMQCRPWDDIERTLAEGRNNGTHKLASALRGKGGYTLENAMEIMSLMQNSETSSAIMSPTCEDGNS
jgi:hypothetical protein